MSIYNKYLFFRMIFRLLNSLIKVVMNIFRYRCSDWVILCALIIFVTKHIDNRIIRNLQMYTVVFYNIRRLFTFVFF